MSAWYESARATIMRTFTTGMQRLAATVLLDAVQDVRRMDGSQRYLDALVWFHSPYTGNLTLHRVCQLLNMNTGRVQRLAFQLHEEGALHDSQ